MRLYNIIKRGFLLSAAALTISSCYNLKSEIYDTINPTLFPLTAEDAEALTNGAYWPMRWQLLANGFTRSMMTVDLCTDVGETNDMQGAWVAWQECRWTVSGGIASAPMGQFGMYHHISLMELNIERVSMIEMNETLKARYMAELKCGQAWMSYIMFDWFGPIPIAPLDVLKDPLKEQIVPRLSNQEMVSYIETKAKEAAAILPYKYDSGEKGRYTKGMANMLLMKLYAKEKMWDKCEAMGRELMKPEYGYGLMASYRDIFTLENEGNKEIIHAINCTVDYGMMLTNYYLPSNFPLTNPKITPLNAFRSPWAFYDKFDPKDKRRELLIADYVGIDGIRYNRDNKGNYLIGGVVPHKYAEDPQSIGFGSQIDYIIFRYADVLTLLAEAIANKSGTPTQEAMDLVNMVRNRAGLESLPLGSYSDLTKFNKLVLDERGFEFWWESIRRTDLIRHGKFIEEAAKFNPAVALQPYRVLFPIPESIITEGKGKIKQNDGY